MNLKQFIPTSIFLLAVLLLLADSFGSDTKVYRYLHIESSMVGLFVILLLLALRLVGKLTIVPWVSKLNTVVVLPLSLISAIALTVWAALSAPNYVFSVTRLHSAQLVLMSLVSLTVFAVSQSDAWYRKHRYPLIFSGAFLFMGYASLAALLPFEVFAKLSHEDGLIESLQVAVLLLSGFFALKVAYYFYQHGIKSHAVIFLLIGLAFFFIAGDEISWGQRLLGLTTPEVLVQNNRQGEITIHNLFVFEHFVGLGYIMIGLFGALVGIFIKDSPYLPHWSCSPYFAFGALYNISAIIYLDTFGVWSESAEFMLYTGLMFTCLVILLHRKPSHS